MPFFEISLETANKFYTWGWRASIAGAVITAVGVILLMSGTRVRDHETESQLSRASLLTAQTSERAAKLEVRAEELSRQNLELEKAVAPRMLEQSASARALERFAGMEAFIVSVLSIYQFSRHPQSFGSGRHLRRSLMARRRPRVNQESFPRASLAG
jgi:uncharacterized membrane protein